MTADDGARATPGADADSVTRPGQASGEQGAPGPDLAAAGGRGLGALAAEDFSFSETIGGVRGLVESVAPGLVFVVVYLSTYELQPALVASLAVAAVATFVRLVQRTPLTQALSGLVGVGIGVLWARTTGAAEDFFALGLVTNAAYMTAAVVSILVGWPLVGIVVGLLRGEGMGWRKDPAKAGERRRYVWATWLWVAMFAARLSVQAPAYFAGDVAVLGSARLAMGVPLWALVMWLTWLLVRRPKVAGVGDALHPAPGAGP